MKTVFKILFALILFFCLTFCAFSFCSQTCYPAFGEIVAIDETENYFTIQDSTGNYWEYSDIEDWQIGDSCAMIMFTKCTKDISDDMILKLKYYN